MENNALQVDYSNWEAGKQFPEWMDEISLATISKGYLLPGEDVRKAYRRVAKAAAFRLKKPELENKFFKIMWNGWLGLASPVISNMGTDRGLPISCYGIDTPDSIRGIGLTNAELMRLTSKGGGVGIGLSKIRPRGTEIAGNGKSEGVVPWAKIYDSTIIATNQGNVRRGAASVNLDIEHEDIDEFLQIRRPKGDPNRQCLNLHQCVVVGDTFMRKLESRDPEALGTWATVLKSRMETGEPYIMFGDTVNAALPEFQRDMGLSVHHSNLCSEITLPTNQHRTAVCCLSSVNLEEFDEWKNNKDFIPDLIRMLDNVISYFISHAPAQLEKAKTSAEQERSLGLGAMGFHAYLQRKNVPFESPMAIGANKMMFEHIKKEAKNASNQLCVERGPCFDGYHAGVRNAHLLAVAPNASSSIICGNTSPSIEPYRANAFTQKTKSGSSLLKNEYLEHALQELDQDTDEVWKSIITNNGSVQHLDFLDDWTKDVFKTAVEIDQRYIIEMAADRQKEICQSQSLNVFFPANVSKQELHAIHMMAWKKKVKTLYYLRSEAIKRAETVSDEALRQYIFDSMDEEGCLACEG